MKKTAFYLFLIIIITFFSACEDQVFESFDGTPGLKKGSKQPTDVKFGDLYGDLIEVEMDLRGVPVLYPLRYLVEFQDAPVDGIIDVANPRLTGSFDLTIYERNEDGFPVEPPATKDVTVEIGEDGFISNYSPVVLYDLEGEILEDVTSHVIPIEQGRLNLIRSSLDVLPRRMSEVIKNFGDGTVAAVIRDYCGRLFMVRTQDALNLGVEDKPIDSPLENMALYKELMLHGFDREAEYGGLNFLVDEDIFHFQTKIDKNWTEDRADVYDYFNSPETKQFMVMNLAASCIAAASDKSGTLKLDEIVLVNRFLGIPKVEGSDTTSFFPVVAQKVRMLNKTDKTAYIKYRYFIDYSFFWYHRLKYENTMVDFYTSEVVDGVYVKKIEDTFKLHDILSGKTYLPGYITDATRYNNKSGLFYKAVGFANQADDYVQALAVIHNNEEFLVWEMPTPTWSTLGESPIDRTKISPFIYLPTSTEGGNGGGGRGGR